MKAYPGAIAGVKDSSGDWNNTKAMLERFAPQGFDVFAGSETFLLDEHARRRRRLHQRDIEREPGGDPRAVRRWK